MRLPFPRDAVKPDFSSRMTLSFTQCAAFSRALDSSVARAAIARREVGATGGASSLKWCGDHARRSARTRAPRNSKASAK